VPRVDDQRIRAPDARRCKGELVTAPGRPPPAPGHPFPDS